MKTLLIVLIFLLSLQPTQEPEEFCRGWEVGYVRGYCYEVQDCVVPVVPICDYPEIFENTFEDGYNRGFLAGLQDKED